MPSRIVRGIHSAVVIEGKGARTDADFGTSGSEYRYAAVAVVADTWWRAKTALDLMPIEWDFGPNAGRTSEDLFQADFETLKQPGTIVLEEGGSYARSQGQGRQGGGGDLYDAASSPMPAWSRATPPPW